MAHDVVPQKLHNFWGFFVSRIRTVVQGRILLTSFSKLSNAIDHHHEDEISLHETRVENLILETRSKPPRSEPQRSFANPSECNSVLSGLRKICDSTGFPVALKPIMSIKLIRRCFLRLCTSIHLSLCNSSGSWQDSGKSDLDDTELHAAGLVAGVWVWAIDVVKDTYCSLNLSPLSQNPFCFEIPETYNIYILRSMHYRPIQKPVSACSFSELASAINPVLFIQECSFYLHKWLLLGIMLHSQ